MTALADEQSLPETTFTIRSWPIPAPDDTMNVLAGGSKSGLWSYMMFPAFTFRFTPVM